MSEAARFVGLFADDAATIGARIFNNKNPDGTPRKKRASLVNPTMPTGAIAKQETTMTTQTETPAEVQVRLDTDLAKLIDAFATPELKATALVKIGKFRTELSKMAPAIRDLTEAQQQAHVTEWLEAGDVELRRGVWNAMAGADEIPLAKRREPSKGELALAKMLSEAPNDTMKGQIMQKVSTYRRELEFGLVAMKGKPDAEVDDAIKAWVAGDTGADSEMKKNILDAEMNRDGRRLYGIGVQADNVVGSVIGNASSHAGSQLQGSETNSDQRIRRTIPTAPKGAGEGSKVPGSDGIMPDGKGGEAVNPGSGGNDKGDPGGSAVRPATLITRRGTTGGLGNSQGSDTAGKKVTGDDTGKGKKKKRPGAGKWDAAAKSELAGDLLKAAPDAMVLELGKLEPAHQVEVMDQATDQSANLISWAATLPTPDKLVKRDVNAAIAEWLSEDPKTVQMKKWVAEALATSEDIPLELAKDIMAWTPPAAAAATGAVRVRQAA